MPASNAVSVANRLDQIRGRTSREGKSSAAPEEKVRGATARFDSNSLKSCIAGDWICERKRRLFCVTEEIPVETLHGSAPLNCWLGGDRETLAAVSKEPRAAAFDPGAVIFMDTETTGLAGGSGTVAFMVGCAVFKQGRLHMQQFFIDDYSEESLLLEKISELFLNAKFLVTFNGKSYDKEVLESRFLLMRMKSPFAHLVHIDLLHASRRIWKDSITDCRLKTLEPAVLGFRRVGDIPGEEIPGIYFDFLTRRDPYRVRGVFEHNRLDLLSLVALLGKLSTLGTSRNVARVAASIDEQRAMGAIDEITSLGKVYFNAKDHKRAAKIFEEALNISDEGPGHRSLNLAYSMCLKSQGRYEEAARVWLGLLESASNFDALPYEELAKHHEHRTRKLAEALRFTEQAVLALKRGSAREPGARSTIMRSFEHRLRRLRRKMGLSQVC